MFRLEGFFGIGPSAACTRSVRHHPAAKACVASRLRPASLVGPRGLVNKKGRGG
jgi:hypothetical protein